MTGGSEPSIPSVDLASFLKGSVDEQRGIAKRVDEICRSTGFLIVTGHGVPATVIDDAWSMARAFFDLPLATKLEARDADPKCPRGYFPYESETLARSRGTETPPDRKESFSSGPLRAPRRGGADANFDFFYGDNRWPREPAGFRNAWTAYYEAMGTFGGELMQLLAASLGLPRDFFTPFHTHHISALRGINYPRSTEPLLPGQRGAGEHSDYGSVTILKPDPGVGGLEVQLPSGTWAPAPPAGDAFIINIGDMMARWTNDRWVSTLHRVVTPVSEDGSMTRRRQSIAYFMHPNYDADIACIPTCLEQGAAPRYAPVRAGPYLIDRFSSAV